MTDQRPKKLEGKSELVVLAMGVLGALGSNASMPTSIDELVKQLNGLDPSSPVYYMFIVYIVVRAFRKWSKEHHELAHRKLDIEEQRIGPNSDIPRPSLRD